MSTRFTVQCPKNIAGVALILTLDFTLYRTKISLEDPFKVGFCPTTVNLEIFHCNIVLSSMIWHRVSVSQITLIVNLVRFCLVNSSFQSWFSDLSCSRISVSCLILTSANESSRSLFPSILSTRSLIYPCPPLSTLRAALVFSYPLRSSGLWELVCD